MEWPNLSPPGIFYETLMHHPTRSDSPHNALHSPSYSTWPRVPYASIWHIRTRGHVTVKSHTDEKYRKSYLHTRVHDYRKITLLMKGHPHEFTFEHTASWSCVAIASFGHANKMIVGLCCGARRLAPPTRMRCYALNEATAAWLVAGLY